MHYDMYINESTASYVIAIIIVYLIKKYPNSTQVACLPTQRKRKSGCSNVIVLIMYTSMLRAILGILVKFSENCNSFIPSCTVSKTARTL